MENHDQEQKADVTNQKGGNERVLPGMPASPNYDWVDLKTAAHLAGIKPRTMRDWCEKSKHGVVGKKEPTEFAPKGAWTVRRDTVPTSADPKKPGRAAGSGEPPVLASLLADLRTANEQIRILAANNGRLESSLGFYKEQQKLLPEAAFTADKARQDAAIAKADAERALKEAAEQKAKAEQAQADVDQAKKEVTGIKENLSDLEVAKKEAELIAATKAKEAEEAEEKAKRMNVEINKVPTFLRRLFKIEDAA